MTMDIELRRLEKSMIAQSQQLSTPEMKTDHLRKNSNSQLCRNIQMGYKKQTHSHLESRNRVVPKKQIKAGGLFQSLEAFPINLQ